MANTTMKPEPFSVSFDWSKLPEPPKRTYTARQVRFYRLLCYLPRSKDGRSVRPWTLGMLWFRVKQWIEIRSGFTEWRFQTMLDEHVSTQVMALAAKFDAEAMKAAHLNFFNPPQERSEIARRILNEPLSIGPESTPPAASISTRWHHDPRSHTGSRDRLDC